VKRLQPNYKYNFKFSYIRNVHHSGFFVLNGTPWNKTKVYAYYAEKDGWSNEEVNAQVFPTYDKNLIRSGKLDKKSIIMYPVPDELTIGKYQIGWNRSLSPAFADKKFIAMLCPKK